MFFYRLTSQSPINIVKDFVFRNKKSREPLIESHVLYNEQYEKLYKEFLTLKRSYRQVITLRKMEELSIKETAAILNWSEGKVKTTLFRAMKTLKKKLERGGYFNEK